MKTPDEIKITKLEKRNHYLEACYKKVSKALCGNENKHINAVLVAVNQLKTRLAQAERERDAAVHDLMYVAPYDACYACKHTFAGTEDTACVDCPDLEHFEWRGVFEENSK